jgi:hypothetical protein
MARKRFTPEQIITMLREAEGGRRDKDSLHRQSIPGLPKQI